MPYLVGGVQVTVNDNSDYGREIRKGFDEIKENYGLKAPEDFVVFDWDDTQKRVDKDNDNRIITPASVKVQYREIVKTMKGSVEWVYYETMQGMGDDLKPFPRDLMFKKTLTLYATDIELIYFLLYKSHIVRDSKNNTPLDTKYLKITDVKKEASKKTLKKQSEFYVFEKLWSTDMAKRLSEDEIRKIGSFYSIPNSTTKQFEVLQNEVESYLKSELVQPTQELKFATPEERLRGIIGDYDKTPSNQKLMERDVDLRLTIQKAIDGKFVKANQKNSAVVYSNGDMLCEFRQGSKLTDAIFAKMSKDNKEFEHLKVYMGEIPEVSDAEKSKIELMELQLKEQARMMAEFQENMKKMNSEPRKVISRPNRKKAEVKV